MTGASVAVASKETSELQVNPVWALREQKGHRRFSADVCAFLLQEFMKGVNTGIKENPTDTARKLKARFTKEHWLSVQLVASYFSRLSSRQKCGRNHSHSCHGWWPQHTGSGYPGSTLKVQLTKKSPEWSGLLTLWQATAGLVEHALLHISRSNVMCPCTCG